jgi:hypothetical protein
MSLFGLFLPHPADFLFPWLMRLQELAKTPANEKSQNMASDSGNGNVGHRNGQRF